MPLPAALLSKLSKRGLIVPSKPSKTVKKEDYKGYVFCPNKVNIFHICTSWCESNWKAHSTIDPTYARNIQKLIFKYPLPSNWTEVFDKAVGRYYYWNIETDLVSWLPPKHPKAIISRSASKLREKKMPSMKMEVRGRDIEDKHDYEDKEFKKPYSRTSARRENDRDRDDKYRKEDKYGSKRPRKDNNTLDPMDPAAYSDIAPGTWSDGLENNKTHADNTASGVLYQQRPYPSPGEVLFGNKEKHLKKH